MNNEEAGRSRVTSVRFCNVVRFQIPGQAGDDVNGQAGDDVNGRSRDDVNGRNRGLRFKIILNSRSK